MNLLGLSAAFVAFMIILMQLNFEYSFDHCHKNADRIYRVDNVTQGLFGIIQPRPLVETFFESSPQIEYGAVLLPYLGDMYFTTTQNGEKSGHKAGIVTCSPDITRIFSFEMIEGNSNCLDDPQSVLISESLANKLFGGESALGQILSYQSSIWTKKNITDLVVGGVYKNFPDNTQLGNYIYTAIDKESEMENWGSNFIAYVLLKNKDKNNADEITTSFNATFDFEKIGYNADMAIKLTPLKSIYLRNESSDNFIIKSGNPSTLRTLLAIAILIIGIAVINYMNFSMALAPRRIRSINTRKVLGETDASLRIKLIIEGVMMSITAYLLSIGLLYLIHTSHLLSFIDINLDPSKNIKPVVIAGLIAVLAGAISTIRPAYYLTSYAPSLILKGNFGLSKKGKTMRGFLIGFQFLISIILIIASIFIYKQNQFMQNYTLGFDKDQVVVVELDTKFINHNKNKYVNSLKDNPSIIDVAFSQQKFGASDEYRQETIGFKDEKAHFFYIAVSWNFLDVMDIPLQEGNPPSENDEIDWTEYKKDREIFAETYRNSRRKLIINKKLSDELGIKPNNYVDHFGVDAQILGVTDNVKFASLRQEPRSAAFVINDPGTMTYSYIKIGAGANIHNVVRHIRKTISDIESTFPVEIEFYEQVFNRLYQKELSTQKTIGSFSLLAIIISIVGVFGLVMFECEYRKKEIGIRKALGSNINEILLLFNNMYMKIYAFSFILAIPITIYIVVKWLDNFAFKTPISWWVFALAGLAVLLITLTTVSWQSWRAATANPVDSLKTE
ncbi:FtsX-like permease family protein [uncultured Proteiniphilum sp.]|uniref:ABC transporter permease n=1 Tax=uncultured Proteiniphilum sp. TaxID=497637 RepID=UPI002602DB8D|nr:FtsX-like permease family protein [uncultured Proteiniphilum sp.]